MKDWIVRAAREWPLGIAIAAALSLFLLPRLIRFDAASEAGERRQLDELRREVDGGDPSVAETRLTALLARPSASPFAEEAKLLLARAILARARSGTFPGVAALQRAWTLLSEAPRSAETRSLRRDAAALMGEYGMTREAVDHLRELLDETADLELALDLVPLLVTFAAEEPGLRHKLLDEASNKISEFRRSAPADRRVKGVLAQARIYREAKRDEDLLQLLVAELAEAKNPADRGLLQLERGRTFLRLGKHRKMEAMTCFDEAERLLVDPMDRGLAAVQQAQLFARESNPECVEVSRRLAAAGSPAAPLALLVAGVHGLKDDPAAALESLRHGFSQIRHPGRLDDVDFPWIYDALQAAAARESDPGRLLRFASVFAEIGRLRPLSTSVAFDHAAVLLRARRFEEGANRLLALGNSEPAVLAAADACAEGGLHLRAASLYRTWFDLQPAGNSAGLFKRAVSLKKAGDAAGAAAGFEEYLARAGASGRFAGAALIEKAELQEPGDALATYDRVLKAREVATSPAREDWARALLGRGRALLKQSRAADARKVLAEYLERYGEGPALRPASLEASWLLVRAWMEERQWKAALTQLREFEARAASFPEADRAPYADLLKDARFVEGDLHFNLEDFAAAFRVYGEAAARASTAEDRLSGLIGRARALARLERKEEARKDYSNARTLFDGDKSIAGRGREYWEIALDALSREVR